MTTHDTAKLTLAQAVAIARKAGDDAHRLRTESCDTDELTLETIAEMQKENERLRDAVVQLRDSIAGCREDVLDQPHLLRLWDLATDVLGEGQCREEG